MNAQQKSLPQAVALAIVDMQNDFVLPGAPACVAGAEATVPTLVRLLALARARAWPVVHVHRLHRPDGSDAELPRRHLFSQGSGICVSGSKGAEIIPALAPLPGEYLLPKTRYSAFLDTPFDALLRRLNVRTLLVGGTQYPNCIRATATDAMARDYHTIVVTDACSAQTPDVAQANVRDMLAMGIDCIPLDDLIRLAGE